MKRSNTVAMNSRLVWVRNVALLVIFLNTVTAEAHPWIDTEESLNGMETRSIHNTSVGYSEERSLAFILDVTGSMENALEDVVRGGKRILSKFLSYNSRLVKNFILVPFRDPDVGPVTKTDNSSKFLEELNNLKIYGGGDNPEMSVTGIIKALEAAEPNSFLYVFTDASAKDDGRLDEALKLIQRKHSQVVFFIIGDYNDTHKEEFSVFEEIARASYGQIYYLLEKSVDEVMKSFLITIQPNKINLLVVLNPELDPHNFVKYDLFVEKDLKEMIVEVAGDCPEVDIWNPLGKKPEKINIPFDLPNNKFIIIENPEPAGNWSLKVTFHPEEAKQFKVDKPLITVKGFRFAYEIKYGFSKMPVDTLSRTTNHPLEKRKNYIYMEVHPAEDTKENKVNLAKFKWENVDIMEINGKPLLSLPMKTIAPSSGGNIFPMRFLAGPFTPPDSLFSLSFRGLDENKNPVTRLTLLHTSEDQASGPPTIINDGNPTEVKVTAGDDYTFHCSTDITEGISYRWKKDGKYYIDINSPGYFTLNEDHSILTLHTKPGYHSGSYTCYASNGVGTATKTFYISVV